MRKIISIIIVALMVAGSFMSIALFKSYPFTKKWTVETVDESRNVGKYTSIAVDKDGNPHISYYDYNHYTLKYAKFLDGSWVVETVDNSSCVGEHSNIVLDSNGYPHICYSSRTGLKYAKWTESNWSIEELGMGGGLYLSMALDSKDCPHIFTTGISYSGPYHLTHDGDNWTSEIVDYIFNARWPSIAVDKDDDLHISYQVTYAGDPWYTGLKYAKWDGTNWDIETVENISSIGGGSSITVDRDGKPHICYYNIFHRDYWADENSGILKYAKLIDNHWNVETICNNSNVGHISIALDNKGNPHISYYDGAKHDLNHAEKAGSDWRSETVDNNGMVGDYTSIAIDNDGNIHISYYDKTNGHLKYATRPSKSPYLLIWLLVIIIAVVAIWIMWKIDSKHKSKKLESPPDG